jgi:hypothetical protein
MVENTIFLFKILGNSCKTIGHFFCCKIIFLNTVLKKFIKILNGKIFAYDILSKTPYMDVNILLTHVKKFGQ